MPSLTSPRRWRAASRPSRALAFAGRHSLAVYLVHQPILIGTLYAVTIWGGLAPKPDFGAFLAACQRACVYGGRTTADCGSACQCVVDVIERSGEAQRLSVLDETHKAELKRLVDACRTP